MRRGEYQAKKLTRQWGDGFRAGAASGALVIRIHGGFCARKRLHRNILARPPHFCASTHFTWRHDQRSWGARRIDMRCLTRRHCAGCSCEKPAGCAISFERVSSRVLVLNSKKNSCGGRPVHVDRPEELGAPHWRVNFFAGYSSHFVAADFKRKKVKKT